MPDDTGIVLDFIELPPCGYVLVLDPDRVIAPTDLVLFRDEACSDWAVITESMALHGRTLSEVEPRVRGIALLDRRARIKQDAELAWLADLAERAASADSAAGGDPLPEFEERRCHCPFQRLYVAVAASRST